MPTNLNKSTQPIALKDLLLNYTFAFYRGGQHGDALRQGVTFNADGTLSGTNQNNERYWKIDNDRLIFLSNKKKETTVWTGLDATYAPNEFRIVGDYVPNPKVKHVLEATPAAVKRVDQDPDFIKAKILVAKLRDYGVKHVVLAPGGRDLTLLRTVENNTQYFKTYHVTDERSAGYFALGVANKVQEPVAVIVTSGTAASNLVPAITEAYYMNLPVIAITADRYPEFHGQGEDQTIEQANMFEPMIKKSVDLPTKSDPRSVRFAGRLVSEALLEMNHKGTGPVHINISFLGTPNMAPIKEAYKLPRLKMVRRVTRQDELPEWDKYVDVLLKTRRILMVYGQNFKPTQEQLANINKFAERYNVTILADWLSNLQGDKVVYSFNSLRKMSQETFNNTLAPDVVLSVGGKNVMNHPINFKLRGAPQEMRNWRIAPDGEVRDLYYHLTAILETNPDWFFKYFADKAEGHQNDNVYLKAWQEADAAAPTHVYKEYNQRYVTQQILEKMPEQSLFHIGVGHTFMMTHTENTVPGKDLEVFLNMGTNGIDGSASAYMGQVAADESDRLKFLVIGDMSFFYDMNSIWNKELKENIRILLINNSRSGLLDHYGSPAVTQEHTAIAEGWVKSLGFDYLSSTTKGEFDKNLKKFVNAKHKAPLFFEVFV
jgi:2-succinyl-5-enolpyruvyl-6-hydroxy-3-cyclohexene-1-carboxylate synthase